MEDARRGQNGYWEKLSLFMRNGRRYKVANNCKDDNSMAVKMVTWLGLVGRSCWWPSAMQG